MVILLRQSMDRTLPRPQTRESDHRVLPFRPRGSLFVRNVPPRPVQVPGLEKYEQAPDEPGEYRHRMMMNVLGFAVAVALIVTGIWMADVLAHLRKSQDCVMLGRTDCAPISVSH